MTDQQTTTTAAAKPKRERRSYYGAKITLRFFVENDDAQACIDKRKRLEAFAKDLGAVDVKGTGEYGSAMFDSPKAEG